METNTIKTIETHADDLISAFKLINEIFNGQELCTIKELIQTTDKARQEDLSNLQQKMESALAKIREDAMAISADLRHTKADMKADRKKGSKEITTALDQMQKASKDIKQEISATETNISVLAQEHFQRFAEIESRVTQCENESTARRKENDRLALSLSNAAQSLASRHTEPLSFATSSAKQVDKILTKFDDSKPEAKDQGSEKNEMTEIDAVLVAIDDLPPLVEQNSE